MDFASRAVHYSPASIRLNESEVRRLTGSERDVIGRLASAQSALGEANAVRRALLTDGESMLNERAIAAAEAKVKSAEGILCELEKVLVSVRHERDLAQQRLEAAHQQERMLDEAASVALAICEIVDAVKAFERASDRLASALDGVHGTHTSPVIAASLRISTTKMAAEACAVLSEVETYRARLLDGSVEPAPSLQPTTVGGDIPPEVLTADPSPSVVPSPTASPAPSFLGAKQDPA